MRFLSKWIDIGDRDSCQNVKHIVNKEYIEVGVISKARFSRKLYKTALAVLELLRQYIHFLIIALVVLSPSSFNCICNLHQRLPFHV